MTLLDPRKNRIDYGEQLVPPDGYTLTCAVGTTYSLDLEAFMMLPVALYYAAHLDGRVEDLHFDVVDAITKASDKITVFYQNAQLKVPRKYHPLIAFCEKRIVPVQMPNHLQSFHPKVWIIRYDQPGERTIYRLLVTSRNLTFDRSWDMAFSTMGYVSDREQRSNEPLLDFVNYLTHTTGREIDPLFLKDLPNVAWEKPDGFKAIQFQPIGITIGHEQEKQYTNPLSRTKWDDLLIMSPFLDQITQKTLRANCAIKPYLLSTKDALDGITEELLDEFECRQFYDFFNNAEFYQENEEEGIDPQAQKLHAKFFIGQKKESVIWHIGSANCTDPAQGRNVEFMISLTTDNIAPYRIKDVFKQMTDEKKAEGITLFVDYNYGQRTDPSEKEKQDHIIRKIKFDLALLSLYGHIVPASQEKTFNLVIELDATNLELASGFSVMIRPVAEAQKKPVPIVPGGIFRTEAFGGYQETHLSPFVEFSIFKGKEQLTRFLLTMRIDLPSSRLHRIMTSIIDSQEKLMKYLTFLLTGEENGELITVQKSKSIRLDFDHALGLSDGTPVFEKLLIACSRYPEKLKDVDALIELLKKEREESDDVIITPAFEGFWNVFKAYMNIGENGR